jgi:hemolysin activation/secretion protein
VLADNHGSRYTGKERLSFNWDWNSPSGYGDRLSVSGLGAVNGDLLNGRIGYSTSLHPSGWRGEVAINRTTYTLGDTYANLDARGVAQGVDVGLTYPIRRIRAQTIEFGLNYAERDLKDEVRSTNSETRKKSRAFTASLSLRDERSLFGFDGLTQASLRITQGDLNIVSAQVLVQAR